MGFLIFGFGTVSSYLVQSPPDLVQSPPYLVQMDLNLVHFCTKFNKGW